MKNNVRFTAVFFTALAIITLTALTACEGPMGPQGLPGDPGADGVSITWRGELASHPSDPQINWAYYNTTDNKAYIWNGSVWQVLAQDGSTGADGVSIAWRGDHASHPANPQLNWAYYNSVDKVSYIWNGSAWQILVDNGSQGGAGLNSYVVIFFGNGGSPALDVVGILHGNTAAPPAVPTRAWYTFTGWYTAGGTLWNFETPITGSITLIAQWAELIPSSPFTNLAEITAYLGSLPANSAANPYPLPVSIDLGIVTEAVNGWHDLLRVIQTAGKYVSLDLGDCTMNGTVFSLDRFTAGQFFIVSLILPDVAESVVSMRMENDFVNLRAISGAGITAIGDSAFRGYGGYANLTSVSFPAAQTIGQSAFSGCTSLAMFNLTGTGDLSVMEGGRALVRNGTELIAYPSASGTVAMDTITSIATGAFYVATSLTSASFPLAETIGSVAFSGCTSLESVHFPAAAFIENQAFSGCTSLVSVSFPAAQTIGGSAFSGCTNLESVHFPAVHTIGNMAFSGCTSLAAITIAANCNINDLNTSSNARFWAFRAYYQSAAVNRAAGTYTWDDDAWTGPE